MWDCGIQMKLHSILKDIKIKILQGVNWIRKA